MGRMIGRLLGIEGGNIREGLLGREIGFLWGSFWKAGVLRRRLRGIWSVEIAV